jgi:hypothetical protein
MEVANFHGSQTLLRINYRHPRDCLPERLKVQRGVVSLIMAINKCAMSKFGGWNFFQREARNLFILFHSTTMYVIVMLVSAKNICSTSFDDRYMIQHN